MGEQRLIDTSTKLPGRKGPILLDGKQTDPTTLDRKYPSGTIWVNRLSNRAFVHLDGGNWKLITMASDDGDISLTRTSSGAWINFSDGTDSFSLYNNAGTPEGSVAANTGSICIDSSSGVIYTKTTDTVNTGWLGCVAGPASATDNIIPRFDGTSGSLIQESAMSISDSGQISNTSLSNFNAYLTADVNNVTGNGTFYTVVFNAVRYDQDNNFNTTTGVFTAPATGTYHFDLALGYDDALNANLRAIGIFIGGTVHFPYFDDINTVAGAGSLTTSFSITDHMDLGDTAYIVVFFVGCGSNTVDILALESEFSGYLVC